jgi:hypothetical protein
MHREYSFYGNYPQIWWPLVSKHFSISRCPHSHMASVFDFFCAISLTVPSQFSRRRDNRDYRRHFTAYLHSDCRDWFSLHSTVSVPAFSFGRNYTDRRLSPQADQETLLPGTTPNQVRQCQNGWIFDISGAGKWCFISVPKVCTTASPYASKTPKWLFSHLGAPSPWPGRSAATKSETAKRKPKQ